MYIDWMNNDFHIQCDDKNEMIYISDIHNES